jgi:hypothetical protein
MASGMATSAPMQVQPRIEAIRAPMAMPLPGSAGAGAPYCAGAYWPYAG